MFKKKNFKLKYKKLLLVFIIFVALLIRVIDLNNTPSGLHADEASFLLNAKSILSSAKDEDGRFLPLTLHSLIDPKPAIYSYLQIPFIALLGQSILAARLPAALFGTASIFLAYYLLKKMGREKTGLIVAAFLAISPWHIVVSRATQEVILSFFFFLLSLCFLIDFFNLQKNKSLIIFFISSFLAMYFYHSAKILLPVLVVSYLIVYFFQKKLPFKKTLMVFLSVSLALLLSVVFQDSVMRFSSIGILGAKEPQIRIFEQIFSATGEAPQFILRAFYNKPVAYFYEFAKEYLQYFSLDYLFLSWGEPKRYLVPFHGLFYLIEAPFLLLGIYSAIRKKNLKPFFLFAFLGLLAPLPAALTAQETPSIIRNFPMLLAIIYFIAEGLIFVFSQKKLKSAFVILCFSLIYLWQIAHFQMQFVVQQKVYQPWHRNNPFSEIASRVKALEADYDLIYTTNDLRPLYTYFALEGLIGLEELQAKPLARNQEDYQISKYRFNRQACYFPEIKTGVLYVAESGCKDKVSKWSELEVLETISYPDGLAVYQLLTLKK